jgi:hypothetical protein
MPHWPFIIGSYVVGSLGLFGLLGHSYLAMLKAERQADALRSKGRT